MKTVGRNGLCGVVVILALSVPAPSAYGARPQLDRQEDCRRAIEEVYWRHRVWPADNPAPKPTLDEALPEVEVRARVERTFRLSQALDAYWKRPVTPAQLQRELDRMARESRDPARFRELLAAVGNDPARAAECIARPALVERVARHYFADDERIHGERKESLRRELASVTSVEQMPEMSGSYFERRLPLDGLDDPETTGRIGELQESADSFFVSAVLERSAEGVRTGVVAWPKRTLDEWLREAAFDSPPDPAPVQFAYRLPRALATEAATAGPYSWTPTAAVPEGAVLNTAIWTGSEMIVWGGQNAGKFDSGSRYDPATDSWTTIAAAGAPSPRSLHTAVWTGSEMIVWGGCGQAHGFCETSTGGRYNPTSDTWTPTGNGGTVPVGRRSHTAVWTGTAMIVWGGCVTGSLGNNQCEVELADGGRYVPASDTWSAVSTAGEPSARLGHTAVWTGSEMVVWGGDPGSVVTNTGGRYNPATNTWGSVTTTGAPSARALHSAVAANGEMIIWGGCNGLVCGGSNATTDSGAVYDPTADLWSTMNAAGGPDARAAHTAVWTGGEMIVWGGRGADYVHRNTGGRYSPASDAWVPTTTANAPLARSSHRAIWSGSEMIVWGGTAGFGTTVGSASGGRYNPASDSWVPTNSSDPGEARADNTVVWTGSEMIVWGGDDRFGSLLTAGTGDRYDPATGSWSPTSVTNAPQLAERAATAVWTGSEMIVWGGQIGTEVLNTGGRYNPTTDTWLATRGAGAPLPRTDHVAVWTGSKMIVWGGNPATVFETNTGGRYDPVTDSWQATNTTGAPPAAAYAEGVWTGQHLVVWGGVGNFADLNTGGRYNSVTNTWLPITTTGAPPARHFQSAHWTGSKLLVWGGMSGNLDNPNYMNDGALYDPVANTWAPIASSGAPGPRIWHGSAWTGSELIVWGGCTGSTSCPNSMNTGGRYDLASDAWVATTLQSAPSARSKPSAVWTGSGMILWGGLARTSGTYTTTGGLYRPVAPPLEVAPPGSSAPLLFVNTTTLSWESATISGVVTFNVYRGELTSLGTGAYGSCLQHGLTSSSATDTETPAAGTGWFYLVTGVNAAGEGPLGNASNGAPRVPAVPCP